MQAAQRSAKGGMGEAHLHDFHRYALCSKFAAAPESGEEATLILNRLYIDHIGPLKSGWDEIQRALQ